MTYKRKLFQNLIQILNKISIFNNIKFKAMICGILLEKKIPIEIINSKSGNIQFFCPGEIPLWRARTLLTKEPETIEWIDSFDAGTILWDIGANIGCYSLYAAMKKVNVLAFEPSAINYYILNKNIEINCLEKLITAYCIAFSNASVAGVLNLSTTISGGAINAFGKNQNSICCGDHVAKVKFRQGMIGFSIDDFIEKYRLKTPNYIKIDVDGIEDKIIENASKVLSHEAIRSILIEMDSSNGPYTSRVLKLLKNKGFELVQKKHSSMFDTGDYSSIYNYIFKRK